MKTPLALALATATLLSVSLPVATPASAASFSPAGTPIIWLNGTIRYRYGVSPYITCNATGQAHTDAAGAAWIDSLTLSGSILCPAITANALPWPLTPTSPVGLQINNLSLASPLGYCPPGVIPAHLDPTGQITFNAFMGSCELNGALNTSRPLSINWP